LSSSKPTLKTRKSDSENLLPEVALQLKVIFTTGPFCNVGLADPLLLPKSQDNNGIELHGAHGLPPEWVDYYDHIKANLDKLDILHKDLNGIISKRITDVFGKNHAKLDAQIKAKSQESMKLLHECEENLTKIAQSSSVGETPSDINVRKNIHKSLATQISEKTVLLRKQQKNLYQRMKDMNGGKSTANDNLITADSRSADDLSPSDAMEMDMCDDMAMDRDQEINQLVDTMNELGHIFKELNHLVIDQGNLLDRIDYNIEQTLINTKKANVQLKKAERAQDSACAKYCIYMLVLLILVFSLILVLKYSA